MKISTRQETMSSLEIAELCGKRHDNVVRDIKRMFKNAGIKGTQFRVPYKMPSGQTANTFHLPRKECDLVLSGYSDKYRYLIIERWYELETEPLLHEVKDLLAIAFGDVVGTANNLMGVGEEKEAHDLCENWEEGLHENELLLKIESDPDPMYRSGAKEYYCGNDKDCQSRFDNLVETEQIVEVY